MKTTQATLYLLGGLLFLTSCLPIPDVRTDLSVPAPDYRMAPAEVQAEYVTLAGFEAPATPARYNRTYYLRYFAPSEPSRTVLILMPGIYGGAANFDVLARQLVASTPELEVWAVDRRANALEDRSASLASLRTGDPMIAYNYYVRNRGTPEGFNPIPADELPFMRRWGLEAHLRDLHEVVKRAEEVAETVILGGHSLGASLASFYAAFRFEDGVGDAHLDGLVLLDGTLGRTGAFGITESLVLGNWEILPNAVGFDEGRGPPYTPLGSDPSFFAEQEVMDVLAALEPHALSPGGFYSFPITNLAVAGLQVDRDFVLSPVFSASVGEPVGARYGGNVVAFLLGGWRGRSSRTVAGVAPGFDAVRWSPGNPAHEPTDLAAFAGSNARTYANVNEWYFPLRLLVDMSALGLDLSEEEGFVPHHEVTAPTLAVGAGRGLVDSLDGFSGYSNLRAGALFSSYIVPGYAHLDLIAARDNPVVPLFSRWLGQITQLGRARRGGGFTLDLPRGLEVSTSPRCTNR